MKQQRKRLVYFCFLLSLKSKFRFNVERKLEQNTVLELMPSPILKKTGTNFIGT